MGDNMEQFGKLRYLEKKGQLHVATSAASAALDLIRWIAAHAAKA